MRPVLEPGICSLLQAKSAVRGKEIGEDRTVMADFDDGRAQPSAIVVLVVLLVLFGAKRLPELARSLGSSVKELQKGLDEGLVDDEESEDTKT